MLIKNKLLKQGFISALLLISVFHEGLSFWGKPLEALAISVIPSFQIAFPCIIQ